MTTLPRRLALLLLLLCLSAVACAMPVAGGLEEGDANRIVVALGRVGIDGNKEPDPAVDGKFRVSVARDETAAAISALQSEELPRPRAPGVLDSVDRGALVPSAAQEHAQLVAGMAGDLERTFESIDGVLAARVHLNVATREPFSGAPPPKTTASVLVEHRGATPPLAEGAIARLVAGGAPGLAPADVAVILVARPAAARAAGSDMAHVGPLVVARGGARLLQVALAGLVVVVAALTGLCLLLYTRLRRLAAEVPPLSS